MLAFLLLLLSPIVSAYTDDSINLLVRSSPTSQARRYCIELAKLPNNRVVNVTAFGWYNPYLASPSVNACNASDLQNSLPSSFSTNTMLIISEHDCKMTEHAWNVQQRFGEGIKLMILTNRTDTRYSLTLNSTAMPVSIPTLIFWTKDFNRLTNSYQNLSNVELSIDFSPIIARRFRPATLLMFLLVLVVLLCGNFWAADEFRRRITEMHSRKISLSVISNITAATDQPESSQIMAKQNAVAPTTPTEDHDPAVIPMTYCIIVFILCFAVGWLLLIYYFPKVMIYILQGTSYKHLTAQKPPRPICITDSCWSLSFFVLVMFCIGAFSSLTSCFNRLSEFIPSVRRYRIPARNVRKPCTCQLGPINAATLFALALSLTMVLVWYFYRHAEWAWVLQDILGAAICISVTSIYRLGNMRVITLILLGFFLYDIFFVFITPYIPLFQAASTPDNPSNATGTTTVAPSGGSAPISQSISRKPSKTPSVMEQVALGFGTNGEVVPLLFALPMFLSESELDPCASVRKSMLGFGDVILPVGDSFIVRVHPRRYGLSFLGHTLNILQTVRYS